jgi:predicted helicase
MALKPERLRSVRTMDDVLKYLADELDWPIDADDLEDATYPYTPDELGIPVDQMPHLVSLRQLQPLTTHQPWGIFFLEFSGPRLPLTPLRRLLHSIVTKKRASGGGNKKTWQLADLLFIITTDTGETVELHFLAFFDAGSPTVEIRSLPWRPSQSPNQHLKRLANELLPHLEWPDDPDNVSEWRAEWREAFKLRHGEAIKSAAALAERMAQTAIDLRIQIREAILVEHGSGPFSRLLAEVRRELVADVDEDRFADMCAQTLVYGILTSRVTDPVSFGASPALSAVPLANPFLAAFFEQVHDQAVDLDLEGSGLEQLVADLRKSNVEAILDQFGSTAKGGDPVIHFYEQFLKQYDHKMRADAGAFYTPQPVVAFMVRTVDELLRSKFGLDMGIADPATWSEVAKKNGFNVPNGVDSDYPFISMIDPATGTGTFLVEWLRQARRSFEATSPSGDWSTHLKAHVLPSMHAFELMLGPYAIAHLKVALELHDQGVDDGEMCILLTDTLDYAAHELQLETMRDPVAVEGEIAAELKVSERFTVVIGNPPYDREQRDTGDGGKRKGGVVRYGVRGGVGPLLDDVIAPMKAAGLGQHVKNLYNDYVYFWRWAAWQSTELPPGPGVIAFITASSYLDGVSMGGLRSLLRRDFDELWIVDLGGEGRGAHVEENVFEIRTPVAIAFGVRSAGGRKDSDAPCTVRYLRIRGNRDEKFAGLRELELMEVDTTEVPGSGLDVLTPRTDSEYSTWPEVTDLFPVIFPGVKAGRTWVIGPSRGVLKLRMQELIAASPRQRQQLFKDSPTGRKVADRLGRTNMPGEWDCSPVRTMVEMPTVARYGYRSFDRQYIEADPRFLDRASAGWSIYGSDQIFFTTLTSTRLGHGPVLTVSPYMPDLDHFRGSYGAKNVMPLFRDRRGHDPNVPNGLLETLTACAGRAVTVEDLAAYVHGLLGTGAFSEKFADELAEGAGPVRVPVTAEPALFERAVSIGRDLLWWHTWGERFAPSTKEVEQLPSATQELNPVHGYPEAFSYDKTNERILVGTGVFGPVSEEIWQFQVSGLKVLQSWLGYRMAVRKGKKSSPLDDIRPSRWTFSDELLYLISIVQHTVEVTPAAAELIGEIADGPLIDANSLPKPTEAERKLPKQH